MTNPPVVELYPLCGDISFWIDCENCNGTGNTGEGDPPESFCPVCVGQGGYWLCNNSDCPTNHQVTP